jgi:uncharacterized ferritin-like protein (DUF455 family)
MELREFAEQVLLAKTLEEKLCCPEVITDEHPGLAMVAPDAPGRPPGLQFKDRRSRQAAFPGLRRLDQEKERGRLLHFFANHELLATELMALVLLRFPEAPAAFRRGVLQTLKDEQNHTRRYMERMRQYGIAFGELPVTGYFWRCISGMENPIDYVAGLCLTFEQANLDFCGHFADTFSKIGDAQSARLLEGIYRDEIGHVAYGLKWFRRWKNPDQSDWDAFSSQLKFPLSPQRAKGPRLNVEGRRAAGLDPAFIAELNVYSQSKGRAPGVYWFNPLTEGFIAYGKGYTPRKSQSLLARDLANLPQFLCRRDDIVLVQERPSLEFLSAVKVAGFALPEFVELQQDALPASMRARKPGVLRPWAWGPDSWELLHPLAAKAAAGQRSLEQGYSEDVAGLYSKAWSAALLRRALSQSLAESWLCTAEEVGVAVDSPSAALEAIRMIRNRGHLKVVAKEAFGLAGHNSIRLWEPEILSAQLRWMEQALEGGHRLVIEPWLERELDFSVQLEMGLSGLKVCGYTGLINDRKGQFQANWAAPNHARRIPAAVTALFREPADLPARLQVFYDSVFALLNEELRRVGYAGPVGIDAFVYRTPEGRCRVKPIVEINPRYTMGRVTVELMKHTAPGCSGVFRLMTLPMLRAKGFTSFEAYAQHLATTAPIRLEGEPVPRIGGGALCLNDPTRAEACLAVLEVNRMPPLPGSSNGDKL